MLGSVSEHEMLVFWLQLVVLLGAARALGGLMQRFGQPAVVGELAAGLLIGPSVLGRLAPGLAHALFPGGDVQSALLLAVSRLGIVLLLVVTGFETDLRLLARLGRASAAVAVGSLMVPLGLGFALAWALPASYVGQAVQRPVFTLFIAVALSISALPVVAKILQDMHLMRRNFGQITLAVGMINDTVGWLLLGVLVGLVHSGGFDLGRLSLTLVALAIFVAGFLTIGQRATDTALRRARRAGEGTRAALTVAFLIAVGGGAVTAALGMEAVIGAFVAGVVLGRSRYLPEDVRLALEGVTHAVVAPVFFATAGLMVDLGSLGTRTDGLAALAVLAVAALSKLSGSYLGGRLSRLSRLESLAVGLGLNARGAMEIVLATIGLATGVLTQSSYTAIVLMAMATSVAAPPLLRPVLRRLEAGPEEAERLQREELLAASVIAKAAHALLPTRGGANSLMAARTLSVVLQPEASVTVLTVTTSGPEEAEESRNLARQLLEMFDDRPRDLLAVPAADPVEVILEECQLGYQLMALGLTEEFHGTHELSDSLQRLLAESPIPVLLVRRPVGATEPEELTDYPLRRLLVPVTGTTVGRAAEEIAYVIASRTGAEVDAVHVVSRSDVPSSQRPAPSVENQLHRARALAERFGGAVSAMLRAGPRAYEELIDAAEERDVDLIVLGAQIRSHDGSPFLGHGTEYLLERAKQPVVAVVFPADHWPG